MFLIRIAVILQLRGVFNKRADGFSDYGPGPSDLQKQLKWADSAAVKKAIPVAAALAGTAMLIDNKHESVKTITDIATMVTQFAQKYTSPDKPPSDSEIREITTRAANKMDTDPILSTALKVSKTIKWPTPKVLLSHLTLPRNDQQTVGIGYINQYGSVFISKLHSTLPTFPFSEEATKVLEKVTANKPIL
jgi:hypothetical protein